MTSKRIFAVVFAALTVLSGAVAGVAVTGSAQAAPQDISSCTVIEESGEYRLTNDLTATGDFACLEVSADNVTIDGNGYTVANDSGPDYGVWTMGQDTVLSDVTVDGFDTGFRVEDTTGATAVGSTFTDNRIGMGTIFGGIAVEDSLFERNTVGVSTAEAGLDSTNSVYRLNDVGISAEGDVSSQGDDVVENAGDGISVQGSMTADDTRVVDNGGNGIVFDEYGIFPGQEQTLTISGSAISDNAEDGIFVPEDGSSDGESDGQTHVVDGSVIADNGGLGVNVEAGNPVANATGNYWGASDGPSSETTDALEDPETGTLADGSGDAVSEGSEAGISNVHFDEYLTENPFADDGDSGTDDGDDSDESDDSDDSDESNGSDESNDSEESDDSQESDNSDSSNESDDAASGDDASADGPAYQIDVAAGDVIETLGDDAEDFYGTQGRLLQAQTVLEDGTVTSTHMVPTGEVTTDLGGCMVSYTPVSYDGDSGDVTLSVSVADDTDCEGVTLTLAGYELPGDDTTFVREHADDQELVAYETVMLDAGQSGTVTIDLSDDAESSEN